MRFLIKIDTEAVRDPRAVALIARGFLRGVIAQNQLLIRTARQAGRPYPKLYESGVRFQRERDPKPGRPRIQEMVDLRTVLARGGGDCKHLTAWRVAELRESGEDPKADIKIYWRMKRLKGRLRLSMYHAEVRRSDGSVEDVSRYLGM